MKKEHFEKLIRIVDSIAIDCAQHLTQQHGQKENEFPYQYFINISKQLHDLLKELEKGKIEF